MRFKVICSKSNERSEDSYIGFADFFFRFFFRKKFKILMHLGVNALFEFNQNPSAGSDVSSTLQVRMCTRRKKRERFLVLKV